MSAVSLSRASLFTRAAAPEALHAAPQKPKGLLRAAYRATSAGSTLRGKLAGAALVAAAAGAASSASIWGLPAQHARCSAALPAQASAGPSSVEEADSPPQYSLLRIAGDGRCLFRSLAQGQHIAAQQDAAAAAAAAGGSQQPHIELLAPDAETAGADGLRQAICKELLNRREELCFFIDEDYDRYVQRMQKAHTWGGEPELAVAAHVLKRPIAVFTQRASQLSLVSRYGREEYAGRHEVPLFFHGAGHYDLLVAAQQGQLAQPRSRL